MKKCDVVAYRKMLKVNMRDQKISVNKHCPCIQYDCSILGNCVLCVQGHLRHKGHIPECFQNLLRPQVEALAKYMEMKTEDSRPKPGSRNKK